MPDYSKGKIYTLRSHQTDQVYIGSTINPLYKRLGDHKCAFKRYQSGKTNFTTSFYLFKFDDVFIELLEKYPCSSKEELTKREGELIRQEVKCVNKHIPGRSKFEYHIDNLDRIQAYHKEYHINHIERRHAYQREWYKTNIDSIKKSRNVRVVCECGVETSKDGLREHKKTLKHETRLKAEKIKTTIKQD